MPGCRFSRNARVPSRGPRWPPPGRRPRLRSAARILAGRPAPTSTASIASAPPAGRWPAPSPATRGCTPAVPRAAPPRSPARCGALRRRRSARPKAAIRERGRARPAAAAVACRHSPGIRPSLTSGCPSLRVSAAKRTVQAMASSSPPPSAKPLIAATEGLPIVSRRRKTRCPRSANSRASTGVSAASSGNIGAGDEGFIARAGQDQARGVRGPPPARSKASSNSSMSAPIQRVELLRAVDGDGGHPIAAGFEADVAVGHMG